MSDVGERLELGGEEGEGADVADVDSALMWRPHSTEVSTLPIVLSTLAKSNILVGVAYPDPIVLRYLN